MGFFKKKLELYFFDIYLNMLHLSYMTFLSTSSGLHQIHMQHNFFEQGYGYAGIPFTRSSENID